jgi:hypothetical protein
VNEKIAIGDHFHSACINLVGLRYDKIGARYKKRGRNDEGSDQLLDLHFEAKLKRIAKAKPKATK